MNDGKYSRSVALMCPTCGHKDFERQGDDGPVRCVNCERVLTREELIRENAENIDAEVDAVKAEVLKDAQKEFKDALRKAFKGSKNIRFK